MKVKTSELIGPALDWAVALCEGFGPDTYMKNIDLRYDVSGRVSCIRVPINREYTVWGPSTKCYQGGPIMEREKIDLEARWHTRGCGVRTEFKEWAATHPKNHGGLIRYTGYGPTQLIAAMRCYVASKLGDEVEVPDELAS